MPPSGLRRLLTRSPVREEVIALSGVNLQVREGEVFGILGPNGAGKTTLIKILTTLLQPTAGTASVAGFDVVNDEEHVKRLIGLVLSEERSFYWRLTGRQNLTFFARLCNIRQPDIQKRINGVLQQMGLTGSADNMFYGYSSGMKQKLSIARALLNDPKVLFLDEPTKSVDVVAIAEIKRFIKNLVGENGDRSVILATHRLEEAEELCDRIAILNKGKVIFCGSVDELKARLGGRQLYTITIIANSGMEDYLTLVEKYCRNGLEVFNTENNSLAKVSFSVSENDNPLSSILGDIVQSGGDIISCEKDSRRLEDMFIDIVEGDTH